MKGRWHLRHVIWLLAVLTTASTLLLLVLSPSTEQRLPFRLAIGPQLATQHGLSGDPAKGGASAYLDAVQALSGVKLELVRAPSIERAVQMLQDKQVDGVAFSLPSTAETLPPSIILSPSFYSGHTVLVTRRSARAQTLKAMNGMRVGVIANGEYRAFLAQSFPSIDAYQMANVDEMLDAVDRGAIDAALGVDAVLAPMSRKRFGDRLLVRVVPDVPPVEIRVASLPHRAAEIEMAYQAYSSLPLAARQDILDRWLDAFYRSPPTLRAMLYHYRLYAVLFCLALLTFLLTVARGRRRARELASRQASAARILTLVNHEMRNGAASVISAIDLLEMENDANERDRLLRSARAAADALKHTLTNALEFMFRNRPDGADSTFLKNASEVVEECLWATRPLAHYKGLRLTMDIDDARSHHALCDARALHHITSNLLSNAIKFSDQGDVAITLRFVAGVGNAGSLTLSVTDAGPGIAQEDIARIFEPLSATRIGRLKHGAGIGLSLCRQIARAHGGDITVFSELGKGATFFAVLRAEAGADLKTVGSQPHINHPLSSNRALVIEDQSAIARIIARRLHHLGFDAHVASSGEEARIAMTELGPFRIITIDNDLLDANGSDIALDIRSVERRQDWPQARLLSVSASSDTIDRSGYVRAGVEIFMEKPIDWAAFDATCGRAEPGSSNQHAVPEQELALMDVYERQMLTDRAALEESLRAENWRGALAMVHRMQGAAAMVADDEVVATLCALQESLKSHAINGTPADGRIWALLDTLSRRE